ncbi:hypothetical protein GCM10010449_39050 [Streptomyces rectiviolaceus]|uniref:Uncharacterized protein n=1 Tax=Streptomyces rectiviolaceus TaxID=332591 RepID=A0ABP6MJ09_9ACTN
MVTRTMVECAGELCAVVESEAGPSASLGRVGGDRRRELDAEGLAGQDSGDGDGDGDDVRVGVGVGVGEGDDGACGRAEAGDGVGADGGGFEAGAGDRDGDGDGESVGGTGDPSGAAVRAGDAAGRAAAWAASAGTGEGDVAELPADTPKPSLRVSDFRNGAPGFPGDTVSP